MFSVYAFARETPDMPKDARVVQASADILNFGPQDPKDKASLEAIREKMLASGAL